MQRTERNRKYYKNLRYITNTFSVKGNRLGYERLAATSQLSLLGVRGLNARETDHISGGAPGDPTDPHLICGPPPRGRTGAAGQPGGCAPRRPRTSRVRPAFPPARPGEADYPPNDVVPQAIMVTFLAPLASNFEGLKDR